MATFEVSEGRKEGARKVTVEYPVAENLAGLVEQFGEEKVYNMALVRINSAIGDIARIAMKQGKTDDEVRSRVEAYTPGKRTGGGRKLSASEKAMRQFARQTKDMTPKERDEEKRRLAAQIRAQLAELEGGEHSDTAF